MHPILLQITVFGWTALGILFLSIIITGGIIRRGAGRKPGCVGIGYVGLVVFAVLSLTAALGGMLGGFVYNAFTLPRYQARVVDHESYISESRDKDGYTRRTRMYQPIVVFRDENGQEQRLKSDVSSSSPKHTGDMLTIGYRPGMNSVAEFSAGKYLLIGGGFVMLLILAYFSVAGIAYASGARMQKLSQVGINILLFFLIPLAMLGFIAGLGYAVIAYFKGDKPDMPVWALAICIFFLLVLLPAFYGYIRMLAGKQR